MFEDVCLVCGRIADGLYCSDVCRDADAVQLPPSSIDHAIDLGFITDSIPPLVSSARPPRNPEDPSAVSSPTSSILTTPSVLDELDTENSDHHLTPATNGIHQKGHDPSTITGAATTMTSAGTTVLDSLLLPPTIQKAQPSPSSPVPHFHLPHQQTQPQTQQQQQPQQQIRSPRLQPTPLLPFARKPGNTNIHTPPPSTQPQHHPSHLHAHPNQSGSSSSSRAGGGGSHHHHQHHHRRTASFNPASGVPPSAGVNPGGGAGTPGPILGGAGAGHASPFSPASRGASGSTGPTTPGLLSVHHHYHSSCSSHSHSRCSTSGHPSPALSPLRVADDNNNSGTIDRAKLLANLEELDLDGARGDRRRRPVVQAAPNQQQQQHHHHHAAQAQEDHDALEKARKRRARASLPAYFSNLVMGVAGVHTSSSKVPSTAVSSGTSSSDEQHKQHRQQQQRQQKIRHVRSKSAMRASDRSAAKLSTSASTFKVGGVVGPTRSNSDGSVAEKTSQAQSPTTPTVLTRNGSRNQLLAFFNSSVTTTSTMTKDGRDNISPPPRGRDREKARGRVRGINTSVGGVAMTPSVEAIVSPITATRHSMTPPGVLINHDGTTAGGASPASYAEKHIRFIAGSVANGSNLGSRTRMLAALQGHLRSPPPPPASASLSGGKSGLSDQSPSSPIAIRPSVSGSSSSGRPPLSAGILEESGEVPFVVPAGSHYTRALAPRLHQRLGGGGVGVGGKLTMSPKSRRYSSPTTSTAGIGAGLHVPIALMMSPAIERPAKPTAIPGANQDKETSTVVFGRGGRRNSRREEEMSPPRPVVRRGWSPVRGRGAAAVFDDDDDEEEDEDEEKEENDDADEEEVEEEEEEEEEPQRGRSRSRIRSRSRARSRSLERERRGGHRRSFGVAGY